ncbi:MAG: hypothetical protein R2857_12755 [Vampirovibrionales bacterium]
MVSEQGTRFTVEEILKQAKSVDKKEAIAQVASISSGGNREVGDLISEAMEGDQGRCYYHRGIQIR